MGVISHANQNATVVKSTHEQKSMLPNYEGLNTDFLTTCLLDDELKSYKETIANLNPFTDETVLWQRRLWDIRFYNQENLPIVIGTLKNKKSFSSKYKKKGLRFLDLPIHMPDQGWKIPDHLIQFKEVIQRAVQHERVINPNFEKDHYVYITVDQGTVKPHLSQRRAGWHGDSYRKINSLKKDVTISTDNIYVVADCCPTLFLKGPFPIEDVNPEDVDAVTKRFADIGKDKKPIMYPAFTVLKMDPYCVHDAGINDSDKPVFRTFVKISFSKIKYTKLGNAKNQLFDYHWPKIPRHGVPYSKDAIYESDHRKDAFNFIEVDPKEIDFNKNSTELSWTKHDIIPCQKTIPVKAIKASTGEILQTRSDDFIITVNVAEEGDWKVTSSSEDTYFMSSERFLKMYDIKTENNSYYSPKPITRKCVQLAKDIRFKAPWGTYQYAKADDYLVFVDESEMHSVPKKLFAQTYKLLK